MANERPGVGGDAAAVLRAIEKVTAELNRIESRQIKQETELKQTRQEVRQSASRKAAGEASTRPGRMGETPTPAAQFRGGDLPREKSVRLSDAAAQASEKEAVARQRLAQVTARADAITTGADARHAEGLARLERNIAGVAQAQAGASQQMHRHGALTTEFLTAAARGQATMAEWRFQIGSTIAKFAGWTAAATAVYGVVAAFRALGTGAMESLDSVNKLTRVINVPNRAATGQGLTNLSQRFNLPIRDVGEAVYEFAKIPENNTPAKAMKAAEAALYGVKVGELDAAEAGKQLISIQQGLGISSTELVGKFDQINQAQNKFGINIGDTQAGLAKSIGAFKAAGGTFDQALAIIGTASRVTGRSGVQIGTALQRSAGLVRRPLNQQQLRSFGIDPSQGISRIYSQAIDMAPSLSGRRRLQLATALSSPQLAPYLVGVLNRPDLYKQFRKETSPEVSKGSAKRELEKQLNSAREQVAQVVNGLQRIGATLANIGAGFLAGTLLKGLNLTLDTVNRLLSLLEKVPEPIRTAGLAALQLYGALRLARRMNVGAAMPTGFLRSTLSDDPLRYGRRQFLQAGRNEIQMYRDQLERTTIERGRNDFLALRGQQRLPGLATEVSRARDSGDVNRMAAATSAYRAQEGEVRRFQAMNLALADEEIYYRQRLLTKEKQLNDARRLSSAQIAATYRTAPVAPVGPPSSQPVRLLGNDISRFAVQSGQPVPMVLGGSQTPGKPRVPGAFAFRAAAAESAVAQQSRLAANLSRLGLVGTGLGRGADALGRTAAKVGPQFTAAGRGIAGAGARLGTAAKSLFAMLGPLDYLLFGAFAAMAAGDAINAKVAKDVSALDAKASAVPTGKEITRLAGLKRKVSANNQGVDPLDPFGTLSNVFESATDLILSGQSISSAEAGTEANRRAQARLLQRAQKYGIRSNRRNYNLTPENLKSEMSQIERERNAGTLGLAEYDRLLGKAIDNAKKNINQFKNRKGYIAKLQEMRRGAATTLAGLFTPGDPKTNTETVKSLSALVSNPMFGSGMKVDPAKALSYGVAQVIADTQMRDTSPSTLASISTLLDDFTKSVSEGVKSELDSGLLFAKGQKARNRLYDRAIAQTRSRIVGGFDKQIDTLEGRIDRRAGQITEAGLTKTGDPKLGARLRQQQLADKRTLEVLRGRRGEVAKAAREQAKALADQKFTENQDLLDAQSAVAVASTGNVGQQIAIQLRRIGSKLASQIKRFGRDSKEVQSTLEQQQQLLTQQAQNELDVLAARGQLAATQDYTALGSAGKTIANLQQQLGKVLGNKRLNDPKRVLDLQNQIAAAQKQSYQARLDQIGQEYDLTAARSRDSLQVARIAVQKARALLANARGDDRKKYLLDYYNALKELDQAKLDRIQAEGELAASRTDDPVELAAIAARTALRVLKASKGKDARMKGRAGLNSARRDYANTLASERMADLDFDVEIGKITTQQEIEGLKKLLTIHNLGKAKKKEILQQIQRLQHEGAQDISSYELTVGDIKLPTVYQVRRAVQTAGRQANSRVAVNNSPTVNVYVSRAVDANQVLEIIDNGLSTSAAGAIRTIR